ncbi:ferredoxin [Candidatus Moduliflexus flocculans]|uniref:Ferredoxin n=1 Tax=Candidatus Moduliflexus flocculans TaxID=1499966 RepID=A0A0S6VU11_9BACT|nr:ferredoxin [Candidatus Moduliflexus flocculans]
MNITFQPEEKTIEILPTQTLLECAHQGGVEIVATCGGKGRCNSCRIQLLDGEFTPPTDEDFRVLGEKRLRQGYRLACKTKVLSDGVVRVIPPISEQLHRILSQTEHEERPLKPDVSKRFLILPQRTEEHQSSDFEDVHEQIGVTEIDIAALRHLPSVLFESRREMTVVCWKNTVIGVEPGYTCERMYGLAFDVGTTTVVGYLLDLHTGQEIAVASALNAQTVYGGDLMSRITFAQQDRAHLQKLHERILKTLNEIVQKVCEQAGIDAQQIYEATIVGNTCMHHLLLHISPVHLGTAPYLAAVREQLVLSAKEFGLHIFPQARIVMLPLIAGFVGADTVGVILATALHTNDQITLAIDIGTNGEIVLGSKECLLACSAAAGTAFEGAQITHGMRGAAGAIDRVAIDDDVHCHVLGEHSAQGICGSGLVDAIAQMLDADVINCNGRLITPEDAEKKGVPIALRRRLRVDSDGKRSFVLMDAHQTESGEPLVITQQDIRELQLAKGAIATGIVMLMQRLGIAEDDIAEILLAGAFGNYIDIDSATRIGLIPDVPRERIRSVGNAAGLGAQLALLSSEAKDEATVIARRTEHLALTNDARFQALFAEQMRFPG